MRTLPEVELFARLNRFQIEARIHGFSATAEALTDIVEHLAAWHPHELPTEALMPARVQQDHG